MTSISGRMIMVAIVGSVLATWLWTGAAFAQRQSVPTPPSKQKTESKAELQQDEVKQLLLMMDTDKNGRISKKERMDFMSKEFDRLDKDKSGELDPKELEQEQVRPSTFASTGK